MRSFSSRRFVEHLRSFAPLIAIVVLGAILRWHEIGRQSLWLDEIWEADTASLPFRHGFLESVRSQTAAAPLDYLGVKVAIRLLGHGTVAPRVWAYLMGVLAVAAIAWAGSEIFRSRRVGLVAAFLLALSAYHVAFSQEARPYAMLVTLGVVLLATFQRAVDRGWLRDWALFSATVATALYTQYFLAFIVAACGLGLVLVTAQQAIAQRGARDALFPWLRRCGAFALAVAAAAVAFLPWLLFAGAGQLLGVDHGYPALPSLDPSRLDQIVLSVLGAGSGGSTQALFSTLYARVIELFALVGFAASRPWRSPGVMALGLIALLLVPAAYVADANAHYFFSLRQVIALLIPLCLLAAAGGAWAWRAAMNRVHLRMWPRTVVMAGAITVAALLAWPALSATYASTYKPDWRSAGDFIAARACADARIYVSYGDFGLRYYHPELVPRVKVWTLAPSLAAAKRLRLERKDWVAVYLPKVPHEYEDEIIAYLARLGYQRTGFNMIDVFGRRTCPAGAPEGP